MKAIATLFVLLACVTDCTFAGDSTFTPDQLLEIHKLLEAEREAIKQEVILELCQENPDICDQIKPQVVIAQPPTKSQPSRSEAPVSSLPAQVSIEPHTASQSMMGTLRNSMTDRSLATDGARFDIEASTASSRASIELGRTLSMFNGNNRGEFANLSFAFSAPLNKDEDNTTIATLDGLTNAFQASMKLSKFNVYGLRMGHLTADGDYTAEYIELCKAAGIDVLKNEICDSNLMKEGLRKNKRSALYANYMALFWDPAAWKSTYGVEATIGYEEFKFREVATLDKNDSNETPWSIGLFGGFIPPSKNAFVSFGLKFQETYKPTDKRTVCPTETELEYLECITGNIGGPNEKKKHLAYIDVRSQLEHMGFSARVTHDFKNDETGVDLPIYLLKSSKGIFNGGLRLGWTSEDDFSFGVFVGSDLKLLD